MRTLTRIAAFSIIAALAASASAREVDDCCANTSLSAVPVHSTTRSSMRRERAVKRDGNVPAKYEYAYPVYDTERTPSVHERGLI